MLYRYPARRLTIICGFLILTEHLLESLKIYRAIPEKISTREKHQLTFMPASMGARSLNGSSLVAISQRRTAKLHMSAARRLISLEDLARASGATHWGWYCLPFSWK